MKVETFYPDIKNTEKLNKLFSLPYSGQDWDIVNANDEKLDDFIKYYLDTDDVQEKVTIFALLLASIDMLETEEEMDNALNSIRRKFELNIKYHLNTIIYWALIGHGSNEEHIFRMTKFMRATLNKVISIDLFEIKNQSIIVNGINLQLLLEESQFSVSISEFVDFLTKETFLNDEDTTLDLSENTNISFEKENEFTHFQIWSSKVGLHYLKVKTSQLTNELEKYEIIR